MEQLSVSMPERTRIKLCGLSRPEEVAHAVALGVDAIGLVFYPPSPRAVSIEQAALLARWVPPFVSIVGLFVNPTATTLRQVTDAVPLTTLQFHGDETPHACQTLAAAEKLPWLRALRIGSVTTASALTQAAQTYTAAHGLLLDALTENYGGSGTTFDWSLIPGALRHRIILSGGLSAHNVGEAIAQVQPYAVDVSTGIEVPGSAGLKDRARMTAFVQAVRRADAVRISSHL